MFVERIKIFFKYAAFIVIAGIIIEFISSFLVGLAGSLILKNLSYESLAFISMIISMLLVLPFAYYFSYKAVTEYLSGGASRWQKHIGISISLGVIFLAAAMGGGIRYLLTGSFNISFGLLPLLLGFIAGRKAESRIVKK